MKRFNLIVLCIVAVCVLAACSKTDSSSSSSAPSEAEAPAESVSETVSEEPFEDVADDLDYEAIIGDLGFLLTNSDWKEPGDIPVANLIAWYGYRINEANASIPDYMSQFLVEGKEGFYFPAGELEAEVIKAFDMNNGYLRSDPTLYDEESETYMMPVEMPSLTETSIEVTRVAVGEAADIVYFELTVIGQTPVIRALTIDKRQDTGPHFISYTNEDGNTSAVAAELSTPDNSNSTETNSEGVESSSSVA